jgi:hypothetical protein
MKNISKMLSSAKKSVDNVRISTLDKISSILAGGRQANAETYTGSELRELRIMLPYGIASSGLDGMNIQVLINGKHSSIVGTYDVNRPDTEPGELILYSKSGSKIEMLNDSSVKISANGSAIMIDNSGNITIQAVGDISISSDS